MGINEPTRDKRVKELTRNQRKQVEGDNLACGGVLVCVGVLKSFLYGDDGVPLKDKY